MLQTKKQWILVNTACNMPPGKLAAQVAHASVGALLAESSWINTNTLAVPCTDTIDWLTGMHTKVVLNGVNEATLRKVETAMREAGFKRLRLVVDSGLTVFDGEPTVTCLGIGPYTPDEVKPFISRLRLHA